MAPNGTGDSDTGNAASPMQASFKGMSCRFCAFAGLSIHGEKWAEAGGGWGMGGAEGGGERGGTLDAALTKAERIRWKDEGWHVPKTLRPPT